MEKVNWLNKQKANYDHFLPISEQRPCEKENIICFAYQTFSQLVATTERFLFFFLPFFSNRHSKTRMSPAN